jgi:biotin-dependent carboxylase-like uncharacterized protein
VSALVVRQPGLLSLLQDRGRMGQARLGLTTGGPMDPLAAALANRLLGNEGNATLIEVSFGGLELVAEGNVQVAVTGAELPVAIEGHERPLWTTLELQDGEVLSMGFSELGCRTYLAVRGGFAVPASFGSTATVPREGIGGLNGGPLRPGDRLDVHAAQPVEGRRLALRDRPRYHQRATVRVVPGYQQQHFPRLEQRRFFGGEYRVSERSDRMGYRLEGPSITCDIKGLLSEGIAPGAIQVPADGQPIVLLNDRQTIGGYPKIGSTLSLDRAYLAQLRPGNSVTFTPISEHTAHNALHLARVFERSRRFEAVSLR